MDYLGTAVSSLASIIFFTLIAAGVMKAYEIATTLSEMKVLLTDIKRNTNGPAPAGPLPSAMMTSESADNLLRAVAEMDHPLPLEPVESERHS